MSILESEEKVISFLTEVGLIPSQDLEVFCNKCGARMVACRINPGKLDFVLYTV